MTTANDKGRFSEEQNDKMIKKAELCVDVDKKVTEPLMP